MRTYTYSWHKFTASQLTERSAFNFCGKVHWRADIYTLVFVVYETSYLKSREKLWQQCKVIVYAICAVIQDHDPRCHNLRLLYALRQIKVARMTNVRDFRPPLYIQYIYIWLFCMAMGKIYVLTNDWWSQLKIHIDTNLMRWPMLSSTLYGVYSDTALNIFLGLLS